ncbi:MAG: hypothetical protein Q9209_001079 [Squamulea sp. 1 TL-2023]
MLNTTSPLYGASVTASVTPQAPCCLEQPSLNLKKDHTVLKSVAVDKIVHLERMDGSGSRLQKRAFPKRRREEPGKVIKQLDAPEQLKIVSQPSKDNKHKHLKNFAYREEAGRGVTVDIFDDGANKDSNDPDNGDNSDINDKPVLFAADMKNMIVVGATNNDGKTWPESQGGDLFDLSGPFEDIICAGQKGKKPVNRSGTSYATGSVSGLAAYLLSLLELSDRLKVDGQTAQKVKDFVLEKACSRIDGEVKVLYNNKKSGLKE